MKQSFFCDLQGGARRRREDRPGREAQALLLWPVGLDPTAHDHLLALRLGARLVAAGERGGEQWRGVEGGGEEWRVVESGGEWGVEEEKVVESSGEQWRGVKVAGSGREEWRGVESSGEESR